LLQCRSKAHLEADKRLTLVAAVLTGCLQTILASAAIRCALKSRTYGRKRSDQTTDNTL
jgi:hypothetical protein